MSCKLIIFPGLISQMCKTSFSRVYPVSDLELHPSLPQLGNLSVSIGGDAVKPDAAEYCRTVSSSELKYCSFRKGGLYLGLFLYSAVQSLMSICKVKEFSVLLFRQVENIGQSRPINNTRMYFWMSDTQNCKLVPDCVSVQAFSSQLPGYSTSVLALGTWRRSLHFEKHEFLFVLILWFG